MQYGSVPIQDRSGRADEDGLSLVPFPRCPSIVVDDLEMFLDQGSCGASTLAQSRSNFVCCFGSSRVPLSHRILVLESPSSGLGTFLDVRGSERFTWFFVGPWV